MPETRAKKIEETKQKLALVETSIANTRNKAAAGHVISPGIVSGLYTEKSQLEAELLKLESTPEAAATASSQPASLTDGEAGASKSPEDAELARKDELVERMMLRPRQYTMTEKAHAQRKAAANSPAKARAMMGNKNAWKTGVFAQGFIRQLFRPCLSTCPNHPCELIDDGEAALGHDCPDKAEFVKGLSAIQKAMRSGDITDLKEIAALRIAANYELLGNIQAELMATRGIVLSEKLDKDGKIIGHEMKPHPLFLVLPKLTEVTKTTAADFMMTPLEIKRQKTDEKKATALSNMMSGLGLGDAPADDAEVESAKEDDAE